MDRNRQLFTEIITCKSKVYWWCSSWYMIYGLTLSNWQCQWTVVLFVPWFSEAMSYTGIATAEDNRCCIWCRGKIYSRTNHICQIDIEKTNLIGDSIRRNFFRELTFAKPYNCFICLSRHSLLCYYLYSDTSANEWPC